jgi:hypothetical protein
MTFIEKNPRRCFPSLYLFLCRMGVASKTSGAIGYAPLALRRVQRERRRSSGYDNAAR